MHARETVLGKVGFLAAAATQRSCGVDTILCVCRTFDFLTRLKDAALANFIADFVEHYDREVPMARVNGMKLYHAKNDAQRACTRERSTIATRAKSVIQALHLIGAAVSTDALAARSTVASSTAWNGECSSYRKQLVVVVAAPLDTDAFSKWRAFAGVKAYLKATREEIGGDLQPLQKIPLCVEDLVFLVSCWRPGTLLTSEAHVQSFNAALFMLSGLRSGAVEGMLSLFRCFFCLLLLSCTHSLLASCR